jgi:dynein heavy chain
MNSVMDDNKVLTLVSNERIPLTREIRLLFEIHCLDHASPATVSRAGMVYVNDQDVPWRALVRVSPPPPTHTPLPSTCHTSAVPLMS